MNPLGVDKDNALFFLLLDPEDEIGVERRCVVKTNSPVRQVPQDEYLSPAKFFLMIAYKCLQVVDELPFPLAAPFVKRCRFNLDVV